jgi:flavin reductase (DIM6/NTAB) family NADH-FMN oxidoreductase RutF
MTIHSSHPFLTPEEGRDPVRRLRARIGGTVSLWTAGEGPERAGLTVSSFMVAAGEPSRVLALLHPDSDLLERLEETGRGVVQLLEWRHRGLAEAFAGLAPAPGGPFRLGEWEQTDWGPRLRGASAWAGFRLDRGSPVEPLRAVGWSVLVDAVLEHVEIGQERHPLVHRRGRYQRPSD